MKRTKRCLSFLLALLLVLWTTVLPALAAADSEVDGAAADTAAYLYGITKSPQVGSIGGEWAILGLARGGYDVPESYYQSYYTAVKNYVTACGGVLSENKYTEYARVILALSAIGRDARSVAGYDLTKPLGDYGKTIWQGINGPVWALLALDSRNYPMPRNPEAATQATRQMYVDRILSSQLSDGGWSLSGTVLDPDITGMALQALAKYQTQEKVAAAVKKALARLSEKQDADGGFSSWNTSNSESVVQVIVALTELGVSLQDSRFVKNGKTMVDHLLTYYQADGGFRHTAGESGSNRMATEQGLYALAAIQRAARGKNSLYRMGDAVTIADSTSDMAKGEGLAGKNAAVNSIAVVYPGKTFTDIGGHANQTAIEALASRGIVNGKTDTLYAPAATITRAEFTAIVVRALGLTPKAVAKFRDVGRGSWFAGYVGTAYTFGIINGTTTTTFSPYGTITRQQAAAMIARAAKLCGLTAAYDEIAARNILAQFSDYVSCAKWAWPSMAFCCDQGILDNSRLTLQPQKKVLRCEMAQMLYNLLEKANLM